MLFARRRWAIRIAERIKDLSIRSPTATTLIRMTIYGSKLYTRKIHADTGLWVRLPESVLIAAMAMAVERTAVEELGRSLAIGPDSAMRLLEGWAQAAAQLATERGGDLARMVSPRD